MKTESDGTTNLIRGEILKGISVNLLSCYINDLFNVFIEILLCTVVSSAGQIVTEHQQNYLHLEEQNYERGVDLRYGYASNSQDGQKILK